jgi:hypothetical protein
MHATLVDLNLFEFLSSISNSFIDLETPDVGQFDGLDLE